MKKLIKYILIVIIIVIAQPAKQTYLSDLIKDFNYSNTVYYFYSSNSVKELSANSIRNGNSFIIEIKLDEVNSFRNSLNTIQGESVSFSGTYDEYIKLKEQLFSRFCFDEDLLSIKTCYGYNKKLSTSVSIDGEIVNLQIAYNNGIITIGTPVILGSY